MRATKSPAIGRPRAGRSLRPGTSTVVATVITRQELVPGTVERIRLRRHVESKGFAGYLEVTSTYLDDTECFEQIQGGETVRTEWRVPTVRPARSTEVIDVGSLRAAIVALAGQAQAFTKDNPPSEAQLTSMLRSYQSILEWRRLAREAMSNAEGAIDVAAEYMKALTDF